MNADNESKEVTAHTAMDEELPDDPPRVLQWVVGGCAILVILMVFFALVYAFVTAVGIV